MSQWVFGSFRFISCVFRIVSDKWGCFHSSVYCHSLSCGWLLLFTHWDNREGTATFFVFIKALVQKINWFNLDGVADVMTCFKIDKLKSEHDALMELGWTCHTPIHTVVRVTIRLSHGRQIGI